MKKLGIYKGKGASHINANLLHQAFNECLHPFGISVRFVTDRDLNDPAQKWRDEIDIFVIGGGAYGVMKDAVSEDARKGIHDFAMEKTTIGICMGGYGLSAGTFFTGEDICKTSDGMNVYEGHAIGSIHVTPALYNGRSNSAAIVTLHHTAQDIYFPSLYWGGPYFELTDPGNSNATPIVTLKIDNNPKPLVLGVSVKQPQGGTSLLLGYHSEAMKPSYLSHWVGRFKSSDEDFARFEREIARHARGKYYVGFAMLLDDARIVPDHSFLRQIFNHSQSRDITVPFKQRHNTAETPAPLFQI